MRLRSACVPGLLLSLLCAAGCMDPLPIPLPDADRVDGGQRDTSVDDLGPVDAPDIDVGPVDGGPDGGSGIILEVGFGESSNFMVAPGTGTATAVPGVQGGYHLDMGFRVRGLSAADFNSGQWIIAYEIRSSGGVVISEPITRVLSLTGITFDGTGQVRTGDRVFFLDSDPSAYSSTTVTLQVRLTRGAASVTNTAEVTLVVP